MEENNPERDQEKKREGKKRQEVAPVRQKVDSEEMNKKNNKINNISKKNQKIRGEKLPKEAKGCLK